MLRSILAIVAGYIAMVVIVKFSGFLIAAAAGLQEGELPSTTAMLMFIAAGFISAIMGGMITANLAPKRPYQHVIVLIILGLFIGLAAMALATGSDPFWYQLSKLVVMVVGFMIGGQWIRMRRQKRR